MSDTTALQRKIDLQAQQIQWLNRKVSSLQRAIEEIINRDPGVSLDVQPILDEMDIAPPL